MNVIDSSAWLEYFGDGPNAAAFAKAIQDTRRLVVPTISIFEVFKRLTQQKGDGDALQAIAVMHQGEVVELSVPLALDAARINLERDLPMADSIMLATSRAFGATLWTQDADFEGLPDVKYVKRRK
ncbi:MAG: type II toxin-antitoxin system VapC family toxin [Candidatus Latescibacteria bacterium]|nr:type II toxin-antitoxin system VapC family toxin [Candidatus Latescibacterota bacterium]